MTNGTVRIGTETAQGDIAIRQASTLTFAPGTQLDPHNIHTIELTTGAYRDALLDLRGAIVTGGSLKSRRLLVNGGPWWGARIYINDATSMSAIEVSEQFELGNSSVDNSFVHYIGDPANTFVMDTMTFGKLPAGIDITVGVSASARASMLIAQDTGGHSHVRTALRVAPGGGGTFTAHLTSMGIGLRSGTGVRRPYGLLDLSAMDGCMLDAETLTIALGRGIDTLDTDNERGELWLPPGTATIGTATIGAPDGVGHGLLSLSNTAFTVTNSLTLNKTAQITIDVGEESSGIDLTADTSGGVHPRSGRDPHGHLPCSARRRRPALRRATSRGSRYSARRVERADD